MRDLVSEYQQYQDATIDDGAELDEEEEVEEEEAEDQSYNYYAKHFGIIIESYYNVLESLPFYPSLILV